MKSWTQNQDMMSHDEVAKRLMGVKDPAVLHQQRIAYQKRKYEELLQKISFLDTHLKSEERRYDYNDDFRPFVFFFKFLARRPDMQCNNPLNKLKLWLPDTVLTSEGDNPPIWLYTTQDGYVHRTDNFTPKNIINKLGSFSSPDELVAVLKKPQGRDFTYVGNDIRLLTLKDLSLISQSIVTNRGDVICIQKFVKSIGPKAFVCRTCWRKDKNPYVWVITSTKDFYSEDENIPEMQRYIANPKIMNSCTIINSIKGRYVEETTPYVANLVKYVEQNVPGARFEEFVADFIKDESGTWWLVNIRGFVLVDKMNVYPKAFLAGPDDADYMPVQIKKKKPDGYQKVAICKYCESPYPAEELLHKMTLKSIIQTDKHLMHRGKTFKWLERSQINQIDTAALYQEHKVCNSCYKLHQETEKLRDVEFEFARVMGIPVCADKRPDQVSATNFPGNSSKALELLEQAQNVHMNTHHDTEENFVVRAQTGLTESALSPRKDMSHYIKRYRLMLYLHMLYDIPKDIDASKSYYIEYSIFDQKQRYKVDLSAAFSVNGDILIPINKVRLFFLFSFDRKGINEYINEQKSITLNLFCESEKLGSVSFALNDFLSDKVIKREMFKVFSGKKLPILSWGLKVTVGLIEGGFEDTTRLKLNEHKNVYLANSDYYTSEALPEEWLQVFQETRHHLSQLLSKSELRSTRYSLSTNRPDSARRRHSKGATLSLSGNIGFPKDGKMRPDSIETPSGLQTLLIPQPKSLFNDENISQVPTDRENEDESLSIVKKILLDSIRDYEKRGDGNVKKKPTSALSSARISHQKSGSMTVRGASPRIKLMSD